MPALGCRPLLQDEGGETLPDRCPFLLPPPAPRRLAPKPHVCVPRSLASGSGVGLRGSEVVASRAGV